MTILKKQSMAGSRPSLTASDSMPKQSTDIPQSWKLDGDISKDLIA